MPRNQRHRRHRRTWRGRPTQWYRLQLQQRRWPRHGSGPATPWQTQSIPAGPEILNVRRLPRGIELLDAPRDNISTRARFSSLIGLIFSYSAAGINAYKGSPEAFSLMILNMMELWVECDKYATTFYPLLLQYGTGFPAQILHPLILPKWEQLLRLAAVEDYVQGRADHQPGPPPWEWAQQGNLTENSFPLRFYEGSPTLKSFREQVNARTEEMKQKKMREWDEKMRNYDRLRCQLKNDKREHWRSATSRWRRSIWIDECEQNCPRCAFENGIRSQIEGLRIQVFHEPLPEDDLLSKTMVYEMLVPEIIQSWRDATLHILVTLAGREAKTKRRAEFYYPESHSIIEEVLERPDFVSCLDGRFRVASEVDDSDEEAKFVEIEDANEDSIIEKHRYCYDIYDTDYSRRSVSDIPELVHQAASSSTYFYPPSTMAEPSLKRWICDTSHSLNDVIASQSDCPDSMRLDEFKAFGSMRAGIALQWPNILMQLAVPVIGFNKLETLYLILQAANQAGPRNDAGPHRVAHSWLADEAFGLALIDKLEDAFTGIQDNWECHIVWCLVLSLVLRLLSLSPSHFVADRCLACLANVRERSIEASLELRKKLEKTDRDMERKDISQRALVMALVCHGTFDVGAERLRAMILEVDASEHPPTAHWLLESSMIIAENVSTRESYQGDRLLVILLHRWRSLSVAVEPLLREAIACDSSCYNCLDMAIRDVWDGYGERQTLWSCPSRQHVHVMASDSPTAQSEKLHRLQYNLLTGSLLINGEPLFIMPSDIQSHATYKRLFGDIILRVAPSTLPGMKFQASHLGHQVHFGMIENELIIRSLKDGLDSELIPASKLAKRFPKLLLSNYTHWLVHTERERDAETKVQSDTYEIIQFRSTRNTWEASKDSQVLYLQLGKDGYGHLRTAWNGNKELEHVGMRSMTATVISDIFRSIEYPEYIHLTLDSEKSKLNIHLPRYQASFSLDYGEDAIRSDQYVDLIVDEDQSLGTLHGLQSRMVLRSKENRGSLAARAVLVPEGQPFFVKERIGYASVYLVPDRTESSIKYHFYYVKELLGFLKGPGTLRSELYLCYLHAVTSHVLPDALTGYTGTERALQILRSDTVSSLARAASAGFGNDVQLLRQIASLSPSRAYFRIPGRRIQSIVWSDVPALAQSDELYVATQEIMNEVLDFESCFPLGLEGLKPLDHSEDSLVKRAIARTSGNDSEKSYEDRDREYGGRNTPAGLETAKLARRLVTLLSDHKPDQLTEQILPSSILNLTQALGCRIPESPGLVYPNYSSSKPQVSDMVGLPRELQLGFDIRWLGLSSVTLRSSWTRLHEWLYQSNMVEEDCGDKYDIMMLFATLCFASGMDSQIMQILLCFAISPGARPRQLEHWEHATATSVPLELTHGAVLDESKLNSLAEEFARDFEYTPGDSSWYRSGVSAEDRRSQRLKFQAAQDKCVEKLLDELKNQGLCENPTITNPSSYAKYISINKFMDEVRILFRSWLRNKQHVDYLRRVIAAAEGFKVLTSTDEDSIPARLIWRYPTPQGFKGLTLTYLLAHSSPPQISAVVPTAFGEFLERREPYKLQSQTKQLLGDLKNIDDSEHPHREVYRKELSASVESLLSSRHGPPSLGADTDGKWLRGELDTHLRICEENVTQMTQSIITLLSRMPYATDQNVAWYPLWPRITTRSLLEQLSHRRWESPELPGFWKQALVEYAKAITTNQRAQRLVRLFARAKWKDLAKEIQNVGHQGWDPLEFPEYLLFEVENELLIRPVQYDIAHEMRRDSGGNAIMQLNMGEGKSSVIVPIVAAGLANGKRVVRVIVTRPQFKQMIHALCTKLGGLLGRQIYTLPFSRQLKPSVEQVQKIAAKAREYAVQGGVLLVQLEHILSMELLGLEAVLSGKDKEEALGKAILQGRVYFEKHAWDIVDESDDIFDAGFELTYTMGSQKTIEYGPQRWQLIQATLEVVQRAIANLQREAHGDGDNASLGNHLQKFGTLDESTVPLLLETVARSMLLGKHEGLTSIPRLSKESRESLLRYMTYPRPTAEDISVMEGVFPNDHDQWPLLLLRGLFAGGVLEFSLRKRWRVNAGLFHDRSPATGLAVPYHAKDFPAPRAEFSHPDVVIILTCLSYYYEGLSDETLEAVFKRLLASDQGETEYINWVRVDRDRLPKTLGGVNLKDRTSCEKIFSILRHNKNVVDYYLSNMLFPREMKEFTKKLSASGWNIAGDRRRPLRGFSGTKDSKSLLPWSIEFKDLDEQQHTNASVLDCVFREENCIRVLGLDAHHTVDSLLQSVVDHKEDIHVILDVGAQFLESNVHVARAWLAKVAPDVAEAVITFSDSHELIVVPRNGDPELFRLTSYYENTEGCLVFLDEAHTRGTDLILPDYYRAAVMIGPQLPKDKLVQACLRMRKLGNGQSLCFFVPDEVKKAIQRMPKFQGDTITKVHLMSWSIWETFLEAEKQGPLWAKHGARHCRQQEAWRKAKENTSPNQPFINMRPDIAERYLEDEAQTLQQRYEPPRGSASHDTIDTVVGLDPSSKTPEAQFIRRRCEELGVGGLGNPSSLREEQERELSIESEEQKVVQKPGAMKAKRPVIHEDVECFVREGTIPPRSGAFRPAFEAFRDTSIAHLVELEEFPDDLLVTTEFVRTVEAGEGFVSDQYHRPVQWIVTKSIDPSTHQSVKQLVVFSPWEVNELLYLVRERGVVTVHLYAPRTSLSCRSVEDLTLYTVPPLPPAWPVPRHLIRLLNLFAGQLFLRSYDEYVKLCDFLRPAQGEVGQGTVTIIGPERPAGMTADTVLHQFTRNPKPFLRMLMANICRDTRDIRGTDLGRILTDLALDEEVFDGREPPSKCCDAMGDEMARSALVTRGQARTAKIVRIPRTFYQIFQQRYLDFPVFEMRKRGEGASGNERESGGRLVGEFESYPIRPDREVDDDSMFPERAKNIGSFALNGCSLCGRRPRSLSGGEDGARWSTNIGKLKESAPACASCALLLQAAEYMEPDRAKSKSAANDQSELEVHYPLGNTHYPVKRIFLRWEGEQRPEEKTYEVYREKSRSEEAMDEYMGSIVQHHPGDVPWIGVASRTQTGGIRDLERAVAWTKFRLEVCEKDHECGGKRRAADDAGPELPTRVLYLGEPGELELDADVRLHETGPNERGQYLALSHCWGKLQPIKTERANLNTHRNTIPWKALTHTFQDAIKFTRQMRIRYLWIDSLCIIQDDEDDRLYEAAQMAGVYQNAYLTIAATAGPDGNFGLFRSPGGPRGCTELELPAKPTDKRSHRREERLFLRRRLPHDAFWTFTPDGPPLLTRAWVFQERLLSARVVHFAHDELVWECGERYACECGEAQARNSGKATAKQGDFRGRAGAQWMAKDDYLERQKKWEKREKGEGGGDGETSPQKERRTRMEFRAFVSTYSHLRLTRETDRLPAFAGIAKWFRDGGQGGSSGDDSGDSDDGERGAYWAGLWQGSLASDLAWQVREPTVPLSARPRVPRTGEPGYVGPTWSWVSAREPFYNLQLVNQDSPPAFTVLDAEFAWRGPDRFGPIASGSLVLSGFVRDVRLQTWRRLSSTRRPMREDDLDMSPNEDVKVGIADEKGDLDVVRLDFAPDWGELGDRAGTGRAPARHRRREWELIGECPDTCQLFYLTARSALLLMREVPGTSVYRRIGVFFEFDEAKLGQRTTLRIV